MVVVYRFCNIYFVIVVWFIENKFDMRIKIKLNLLKYILYNKCMYLLSDILMSIYCKQNFLDIKDMVFVILCIIYSVIYQVKGIKYVINENFFYKVLLFN